MRLKEYLYYPTLDRYLALSALTPLVRYLELPERILHWRLRRRCGSS